MIAMDDSRTRLARAVEDAISDAGLEYTEVARRAGFSVETLSKIRAGRRVRIPTLRRLEEALRWPKGRTERLLAGAEVTDAPEWIRVPFPDGWPIIWEGETRDTHPLQEGEVLRWRRTDRGIAYRLETTDPVASIDYAFPEEKPVDELVEVLRRMVASHMEETQQTGEHDRQ